MAPRYRIARTCVGLRPEGHDHRIRDIAEMVRQEVPGSIVTYAPGGGPDLRCYRVDCSKIAKLLPEFQPRWTVRKGVKQLHAAGVSDAVLHTIQVDNPRRFLAFVPKRA